MTEQTRPAPTRAFYDGPVCSRCGHEPHDDRTDPRCGEIVGGWDQPKATPDYCGCADVDALYARAVRAEAFIGRITPDEWATIDKAREAAQFSGSGR